MLVIFKSVIELHNITRDIARIEHNGNDMQIQSQVRRHIPPTVGSTCRLLLLI